MEGRWWEVEVSGSLVEVGGGRGRWVNGLVFPKTDLILF